MKKILTFIFTLSLMVIFASCKKDNDSNDNNFDKENAIVVYFSATNNTKKIAEDISNYLNIAIYELEPLNPYTSNDLNYSNPNSRVVKEHEDLNRHVELQNVSFDGFEEAKYIFLGAPVWWQELSFVIDDFLKLNDFTGKTIIPFATSASSSFSTSRHVALAPNATWISGQRFSSRATSSQVESWINGLNLN